MALSLAALVALTACRIELGTPETNARSHDLSGAPQGRVMIYSSMYRSVIDAVTPALEAKLPNVEIEWLQSGSEKIATRLDAELRAGETPCDLVLTSDPFWYLRLEREGHLAAYASIRALSLDRELVDPEGAFVTSRLSVMVLAYNSKKIEAKDAPRSFQDLFSARFKGRIAVPDPLASGTSLTTFAALADAHGIDIFEKIRASDALVSGGNSAVFAKIESGEHDVGFILLENVLAGKRNQSPVDFVIPEEGAVMIPGPVAVLAKSRNPVAARAVYDLILSDEIQKLIVAGDLHSPYPHIAAPHGAPPLEKLLDTKYRFTPQFAERALAGMDELRTKLSALGHAE